MTAISLFGYTRAYVAIAALLAFTVAWGASSRLLWGTGWTDAPATRLVTAACQMMVVLVVPALAVRRMGHRIYR